MFSFLKHDALFEGCYFTSEYTFGYTPKFSFFFLSKKFFNADFVFYLNK